MWGRSPPARWGLPGSGPGARAHRARGRTGTPMPLAATCEGEFSGNVTHYAGKGVAKYGLVSPGYLAPCHCPETPSTTLTRPGPFSLTATLCGTCTSS
jgi:hypothetical protein